MSNELSYGPNLHPYQEFCVKFIMTHPRCGLFLSMGLGKTLITLVALGRLQEPGNILIIAPKTIAKATWEQEIQKWKINVRTKSLLVNERGNDLSVKKRHALYEAIPESPPTMYFINREKFVDLVEHLPIRNGVQIWPFSTVVVDEFQSFKSYASKRTKTMMKYAMYPKRFIGLSGTPAPNGLMDLWPQITILDGGARLGKTITEYRNRWFMPSMCIDGHPVNWKPLAGAENEIYQRISDITVSVNNPNIKLPDVTYNDLTVSLDPKEMKAYKGFMKESAMLLEDGTTVTAKNAGQLRIKLTQMASGSIYKQKGSADYVIIHEKKLDACEYIINNSSGGILIAYQFQADREMLKTRFPDAVIFDGRVETINAWNEGKIPILLINPASAGHGLNLQAGGWTVIWYTTPMNLEHYLQLNARLARQGQTHPVIIHHVMVDHTVDSANMRLIQEKDYSENRMLKALQAVVDDGLT